MKHYTTDHREYEDLCNTIEMYKALLKFIHHYSDLFCSVVLYVAL